MSAVVTVDPTTGEVIAEYPTFDDAAVEAAIAGVYASAAGIRDFTTIRTYWIAASARA